MPYPRINMETQTINVRPDSVRGMYDPTPSREAALILSDSVRYE